MLQFNPHYCTLCPRRCGADRTQTRGLCGGGASPRLARAALHFWEEPCISGTQGSGTVFFSGCTLGCCFCQNGPISARNFGQDISTQRLAEIFLELQAQGAHNINLVTASQYIPWIIEALQMVKPQLHIPIVYNSGGYETVETLQLLEGWVDIYLPDFKYVSAQKAERYSRAADYFPVASAALLEMFRQVGPTVLDEDGLLQKGLVVRHLVLPGSWQDSVQVLDWLAEHLPLNQIQISMMSQYTPAWESHKYKELTRRVSSLEYNHVLTHMEALGIRQGYTQQRTSAQEEYTPPFDLQGVEREFIHG